MAVTTAITAMVDQSDILNGRLIPIHPIRRILWISRICCVPAMSLCTLFTTRTCLEYLPATHGFACCARPVLKREQWPIPGAARFSQVKKYDHQATWNSLGNIRSVLVLHVSQRRVSGRQ